MAEFEVFNSGFPGDTTLELIKRFQMSVADLNPDLVVLLIGSNDMLYPGHMLDIDTYAQKLNTLLDRIAMTGAEALLLTAPRFITELLVENYPATVEHKYSPEKRLLMLNDVIRDISRERGIEFVDLYKLIEPVDESAGSLIMNPVNSSRRDGMHFTAEGNRVVAENVCRCCLKYYPEARRIVCLGDSLTYGVYMPGKGTAEVDALTYPGILHKLLNG